MSCERVLGRFGVPVDSPLEHVELRAEPRAVHTARAWVRERAGAVAEDAAALELLTSELVTNAVLHARTRITLGVTILENSVLVTVADRNLLQPEQQPYSGTRTGGRGITLLHAMADDWGVESDESGKTVYFLLARHQVGAGGDLGQRR